MSYLKDAYRILEEEISTEVVDDCSDGCHCKKHESFYPRRFSISTKCTLGGARGVMVIVVGNGHGDTSSKPG